MSLKYYLRQAMACYIASEGLPKPPPVLVNSRPTTINDSARSRSPLKSARVAIPLSSSKSAANSEKLIPRCPLQTCGTAAAEETSWVTVTRYGCKKSHTIVVPNKEGPSSFQFCNQTSLPKEKSFNASKLPKTVDKRLVLRLATEHDWRKLSP